MRTARAAAPALAIEIVPLPIESSDTDIERAVASFASTPNGALVVPPDATTFARRDFVIALAARYHLPAVYGYRQIVDAGGLMSYGVDLGDLWRLSASDVDRILRGANPADLPVHAPTKFETVVNLKTAKALGLDVPPSLLVRADDSWHSSKRFLAEVRRVNKLEYRNTNQTPMVKLAPLPCRAQFLNVIESVFNGMSISIIHNSDYESVDAAKAAIDRYFGERNSYFKQNPKRAGNKIWGDELVPSKFSESNNCKNPQLMSLANVR